MHFSLTTLALILSFSSTLLAAPQKSSPLTPRAAPQNPTNLLLSSPSIFNGTSPLTYSPFGVTCYNSDFNRAYINYDSCRPTFYHLSNEHSYREDRPYTSRNPRQVGGGKDCDMKVWKGPENVAVNDQYVAAMAAWVLQECRPDRHRGTGYGGAARLTKDLLVEARGYKS